MFTRRRALLGAGLVGLLGVLRGTDSSASARTAPGEPAPALFIGTHGPEDASRATFPFLLARGVARAGQPVAILLMGDSTRLLGPGVLEHVEADGPPPLREIVPDLASVPLYVCMSCARARGITDEDLAAHGGAWVSGGQVEALIAGAGRVATF